MASDSSDPCDSEMDELQAIRILFVEDEFLVATLLKEDLYAAGYVVLGPFTSLASATEASRRETFDLALLDVNLNGQMVYPLADELSERGIPYIFVSGYGLENMPERFGSVPRVAKPYEPATLFREIRRVVPGR